MFALCARLNAHLAPLALMLALAFMPVLALMPAFALMLAFALTDAVRRHFRRPMEPPN